jgi:uncharacterized SAM-binding protein YcdF (DUF218 family)
MLAKSRRLLVTIGVLMSLMFCWIPFRVFQYLQNNSLEPQAYLVLGGDVRRELYAAELAKNHPERIILISGGSPDPCIYMMFKRHEAPMRNVWLEHCAKNTLENFMFSMPILERLHARKVIVVSNYPQTQRAMPAARIIFGSHGIPVLLDELPPSKGKRRAEVIAFVLLAVGWACLSQIFQPQCAEVSNLPSVDMPSWDKRGFHCKRRLEK